MFLSYKQGEALALSWLRSSITNPKIFALEMGINVRAVQKWRSGEAQIPRARIKEILAISRNEMDQLDRLKQETDAYLLTLSDPGDFKASAKLFLGSSATFYGGAH